MVIKTTIDDDRLIFIHERCPEVKGPLRHTVEFTNTGNVDTELTPGYRSLTGQLLKWVEDGISEPLTGEPDIRSLIKNSLSCYLGTIYFRPHIALLEEIGDSGISITQQLTLGDDDYFTLPFDVLDEPKPLADRITEWLNDQYDGVLNDKITLPPIDDVPADPDDELSVPVPGVGLVSAVPFDWLYYVRLERIVYGEKCDIYVDVRLSTDAVNVPVISGNDPFDSWRVTYI